MRIESMGKGEKSYYYTDGEGNSVLGQSVFTFTCTSNYIEVTCALNIPKSLLSICIDSSTSQCYSPNHNTFTNYCLISNTTITTANGWKLKVLGKGNVQIELPNGAKDTNTLLKEAIHAPDIAFTLISVSQLNNMKCSAIFNRGMCTIRNPSGHTMVTFHLQPSSTQLQRATSQISSLTLS